MSPLDDLTREAEASQSDALLVWRNGELLTERFFGRPAGAVDLMSITKSIVSLAVGLLIEENKIPSVDVPLSHYYPEWRNSPHARITLRHVLTHVSGLQHGESAAELEAADDRTLYAINSPLVNAPGSRFSYNNEATQLLPHLVEMAAGCPLDEYVQARIFRPLGIAEWSWKKDKAGTPLAYSGLSLGARDLLSIGIWLQGTRLLPWIANTFLWWAQPGVVYAHGWLGQYLAILPDRQILGVRLHRIRADGGQAENGECGFPAFLEKLARLT